MYIDNFLFKLKKRFFKMIVKFIKILIITNKYINCFFKVK